MSQPARGPERSAPDADPLPRLLIYRISSRPAPPLIEPDMIPGAPEHHGANLLSVAACRGSGQQIDVLTRGWFACICAYLFSDQTQFILMEENHAQKLIWIKEVHRNSCCSVGTVPLQSANK